MLKHIAAPSMWKFQWKITTKCFQSQPQKLNEIQLKLSLFWWFCYYRGTHACSNHGYFFLKQKKKGKKNSSGLKICRTLKKSFKKRNPSILWNCFWELSWKSQQDKPKKIIYGELWLLQWICAYTLIHLIKLFDWIMGYKTRGTQKNSNQSVTRSYHLLTVHYTNVNPDQEKKNHAAVTYYDFQ